MKIEPLGERVLIKILKQASQTESGIYLPETAKEKPQEGEVVALGGLRSTRTMCLWRSVTSCCIPSTLAPRSRSTAKSI